MKKKHRGQAGRARLQASADFENLILRWIRVMLAGLAKSADMLVVLLFVRRRAAT
jgi:hypothetical protein